MEALFLAHLNGPEGVFLAVSAVIAALLGPNHNRTARFFCCLLWVLWGTIFTLLAIAVFLQRGPLGYDGIAWFSGTSLISVFMFSLIKPRLMIER
jgi:hypothetical protein